MNSSIDPGAAVDAGAPAVQPGRYRGRTVLLTGGAQGLGLAMARRFAAEGAAVHVADVQAPPGDVAPATQGEGFVRSRVVDVTAEDDVHAWVDETVREVGRIDVLVNNAGVIRDNRIENISLADWRSVLDVSLTGAFLCARAVVEIMKAQAYGRVLSFSSMSWRGNFGQSNYVAAKAGVVGLTRALALEGARHGVTANAIAPGLIDTPMLASMNGPARDKLVSRVPMRRVGRPEDIAEAAAYLCSEAAGFVTGVVLDVDGGISIGSSLR